MPSSRRTENPVSSGRRTCRRVQIHALTRVCVSVTAVVLTIAPSVSAQSAEAFYKRNCGACHTIGGGRMLGPDLKNVEQRKDRKWLIDFLMDHRRKRCAYSRGRPDACAGIAVSRLCAGCQLCGPLAQNESGIMER